MHEYSIVQSLYAAVAGHAQKRGASAVHSIRVRIGEASGVDPGLLKTAWETFRVRTPCEAAPIDIEVVPAEWVCSLCGAVLPRGGVLTCGPCGAPARLKRGDEILLDRIVMEVP